ncbi:MAG TPA: polysaccharide pyruvyl transferase family protein [Aerococcaceae bacterium]|nr:polysaccharide pyruvyl transferase family protein [Aerococcaceae bacterium]
MKKIGIVTLHGYFNYGNKLQNYALKYTLEKMGYDVATTVVTDVEQENSALKNKINNIKKIGISEFSKIIFNKFFSKKNKKIEKEIVQNREAFFKEFSKKYLNEKFFNLKNVDDRVQMDEFDFFVTGSDQVWNPFYFEKLDIFFLTFAKKKRRISYAPSMSVDKLPPQYISDYKKWLFDMNSISIREEAGAKIIKEITDKDVPVVVDPTLLLSKKEWMSVAKKPDYFPDKKYILTYFLGETPPKALEKINLINSKEEYEIINLGQISEREIYESGPEEFIYYIEKSSIFLTDSFHGVVFSMLMETPFIVYERKSKTRSMYSRIETLLKMFNLEKREDKNINGNFLELDFSHIEKILDNEKNKSINYLRNAFEKNVE